MDLATGVMGSLLPKLVELLKEEYKLQTGVKNAVQYLHHELELMGAFLYYLENMPVDQLDVQVREWTRQARELIYDIEHGVDIFQAHQLRAVATLAAGPKGFIAKISFKLATVKARRQFATYIRELRCRIDDSIKRRLRFGVDVPSRTRSPRLYKSDDDYELVGLDGPVEELVKILTEGSTSNRQLKVASIVGPAGVGKTALARQVFRRLEPQFECMVWVTVSTKPYIKVVLSNILRQIGQYDVPYNLGSMNEREAIGDIRNVLEDNRYLIVVDDIWDIPAWDAIKYAFVENNKGSAVLMTSRITDVALRAGCLYTLAPLSEIYSRKLFHKRKFGSEDNCPPWLAEISEMILEKCGGIPLAIISLAVFLANKPSTKESWSDVLDLCDIRSSLALSYTDLPRDLKPCLLYVSMFQRDSKIRADRLVWGWIAEGFIHEKDGMTLQQVGEHYLHELINRNLIHIGAWGEALLCSVDRNVHDWIVSLSNEEFFSTILDGRKVRNLTSKIHRLSIQGNNPLPQVGLSHVRSLVVSGDANLMPSLSEFGNLRVLDFAGCGDSLKNEHLKGIGSLFLLRCLVVGGACITDIPKEIENLVFLQILDLRESNVKELPETIVRVRQLRWLYVNSHTKIPDGIGNLSGLEELGDINISKPELLKELCSLTKLIVLGISIWSWDGSYDDALRHYLSSLLVSNQNIQSLSISTCCSLTLLDKLDAQWAPRSLQKLEIRHGTFLALPKWVSSLENLSSLSIEVYKLSQEIIDVLGQLHSLCSLSLTSKHAPEARFGDCTDGFGKLTGFHFVSNAMGKIFEPEAMRMLKRLKLSFQASRTKDVFQGFDFGLENLSSLEHVRVEIICFDANPQVVEEAKAAIGEALYRDPSHRPNLEMHMVENEDEGLQIVEDIKSPDEHTQSARSADGNIPVQPDPCIRPNANKTDEVGNLLTQLMIDNMHLQLQLFNHNLKVKDMLRDIRLNDTENLLLVQAARDRTEDLMKQVLDIGYGPSKMPDFRTSSDKSGNVERGIPEETIQDHVNKLHTDEENLTIGKEVRGPAERESRSTFDKPNQFVSDDFSKRSVILEHHKTQNVSEQNMCTEKDNRTIAHINSSKVSEVLVHIDDVCIPKKTMEILTKDDASDKYLDDKLINARIYCLRNKYLGDTRDEGKIFFEDAVNCRLLHRDGKHAMFQNAIEKEENKLRAINYLKHDMIFLPINSNVHWYLAVVSAKQHEIQVLDSMPSRNEEREELKFVLKGMEMYLELATDKETIQTNSWPNFNVTSWKVRVVEGLPRQEDGSSCGLFMLKYIEYWTGARLSVSFTQDDINQFRRKLATMLVNNPLNQINIYKETEGLQS